MADHFLQFSQGLSDLSPDEAQWLQRQLQQIYIFGNAEYALQELPANKRPAEADWSGARAYADRDWCDSTDLMGFEFEFRDRDEDHGRHLWLFAQEFGSVDKVTHVVQKFLRQWRPDDCWTMTYAATCSKPRIDAFDGGAVFVTANEIKDFSSFDFLEEQRKLFDARRPQTQPAPA